MQHHYFPFLLLLGALFLAPHTEAALRDTTRRYTFSDFFDAIDLPTMVGVSFSANSQVEGVGVNTTFRLGWRQHRSAGAFAYIGYDTHTAKYKDLNLGTDCKIISGDAWHNDLAFCAGYRLPLVKDLHAFYDSPYFAKVNWFIAAGPGVNIIDLRKVESGTTEQSNIRLGDWSAASVVPTMRFSTGFEFLPIPNLAVFAELAYTQHLMPTLLERSAGASPTGPLTASIGLSMFF